MLAFWKMLNYQAMEGTKEKHLFLKFHGTFIISMLNTSPSIFKSILAVLNIFVT